MSQNRSTHARKNYAQPHVVLTNDDLLTEILIRLPILCISLFTTVSKQWLRILTSPDFTRNRRKIPNLDPPACLFVNHLRSLFVCDFVSLDSRLDSRKSTMDNSFGSADEVDHVRILQSYSTPRSIGNNDKSLSESQLDHEMVDRFVEVVVKVVLNVGIGRVIMMCGCFLEKLELLFEQDIDVEEGRFEGDEDGGKV
ncbi:hypothetical protein Tco_1207815 [Tanacetum coccineum]